MNTKNSIEVEITGKVIKIVITATSQKTANLFFDRIESLCLDVLKTDLEVEWEEKPK